jgi:hypothetical protein
MPIAITPLAVILEETSCGSDSPDIYPFNNAIRDENDSAPDSLFQSKISPDTPFNSDI